MAIERVGDLSLASQYYEKAYLNSKILNGDNDHQTVSILQKFTELRQTLISGVTVSSGITV